MIARFAEHGLMLSVKWPRSRSEVTCAMCNADEDLKRLGTNFFCFKHR